VKPLPVSVFTQLAGGVAYNVAPDAAITGFSTDNRETKPGDLFLAIKGANVDGHDFAASAIKNGAVAALVEKPVEAPHILVANLVQALAKFAKAKRQQFEGPVVAVTGSAGKTTTKEMIAAALSPLGKVLKTTGNRNSEYTSPLIWAELTPEHKAVVVEMGMRGFGQIAHLASFTQPTIGVVTNIGVSHIELVGSREGIVKAKGELLEALPQNGFAIVWAEDQYLQGLKSKTKSQVMTFGFSQHADCRITNYTVNGWKECRIEGKLHEHPFHAVLPGVGRHLALNAACAVLVAACAGVRPADAGEALANSEIPPMRMQILEHNGVTYILDAYNASPPSVIAALETLADARVQGKRIAVLGEMRELGSHTEEGHREVGRAAVQTGINELILIGEPTKWIAEAAENKGFPKDRIHHANSIQEVTAHIKNAKPGDAVLIKGSRALELERAVEFLKEPTPH